MLLKLHFTENTLFLKLFLKNPKGLIDIVVANTDLHVVDTTSLNMDRKDVN